MTPPASDAIYSEPAHHATGAPLRRSIVRFARLLTISLAAVALTLATLWSVAAIYFSDVSPSSSPRMWSALIYLAAAVAAVVFAPKWRWTALALLVMFGGTLVFFFTRTPGANKSWTLDVSRTPTARIDGDILTITNVRNFRYPKTESDPIPNWETRTYDLSKLRRVDYVLSYWAGESVAHAMVSFGFDDGQQLAISIETRKEVGEEYSAIQGFFRQYELVYVFADERDLIGLRSNIRGEHVYVHRLRTQPHRAREVLMDYIEEANQLAKRPQFYNALTENCATGVIHHFSTDKWKPSPWTLSLLLPGYSGRWAYDMGATDTSLPYEQFRKRCNVDEEAIAAGLDNAEFSKLIRVNVPDPDR